MDNSAVKKTKINLNNDLMKLWGNFKEKEDYMTAIYEKGVIEEEQQISDGKKKRKPDSKRKERREKRQKT